MKRVGRIGRRLRNPTGLLVLIAGPDGSGKSSLASSLPGACRGTFRRELHIHWSPGPLPRPGALLARAAADPSAPHARPRHGRIVSLLLLGYYWTDFMLGSWLRAWPFREGTGLVVMERGWHDFAVDPRRYRLQVPGWLVRSLGRALPRPDVTLVLEAPPAQLRARKPELSEAELGEQQTRWRHVPPAKLATVRLDASQPLDEVVVAARSELLGALERRIASGLGAGWAGLPRPRHFRWLVPRGPRAVAVAGLAIYQPVTTRGRLGWEAARLVARLGGFRLLPRAVAPPPAVRQAVAEYVPRGGSLAVWNATNPGRYVVLVLDKGGVCRAVAKVGTGAENEAKLAREVAAIDEVAGLLRPPLCAPRLLAHEPGVLVFEAVPWKPRLRPWLLPEQVAFALGEFFRAGAGGDGHGAVHGDCAPWNLLQTGTGWVLVDWEEASTVGSPFQDVCHYLVQTHILLRRPSERALLQGFLLGTGRVGRTVRAYADGAHLVPGEAGAFLRSYLLESLQARLDIETTEDRVDLAGRQRLLTLLGP